MLNIILGILVELIYHGILQAIKNKVYQAKLRTMKLCLIRPVFQTRLCTLGQPRLYGLGIHLLISFSFKCASSLLTIIWFLVAHFLAYTSLNTCLYTSKHLWWLVFGIMSILYATVLELVILCFIGYVLGPIIYVSKLISLDYLHAHSALDLLEHPSTLLWKASSSKSVRYHTRC